MALKKNQLSKEYTRLILQELKNGMYTNAARLPSETELAKEFGISRTLLRDCLSTLEREGFITRKHGIGTIINKHVLAVDTRIDLEQEFLEMVHSTGHSPKITQLDYKFIKDPEIEKKMNIYNKPFLKVSRVITADDRPVIYCEDFISSIIIKTKNFNLESLNRPIFDFLEKYCSTEVYMDLTQIRAQTANLHVSQKLGISLGECLLYLDEIGYNLVGQPVLYSKEYYVNDAFSHTILRQKI